MTNDHGRPGPVSVAARKGLARVTAVALTVLLAGCDSDPLAILDEEPPAPETASQAATRQSADEAAAAAAAEPTPDLRDVPERPTASSTPSTREKVVEGLIADRSNARYTDEAVRLQGTGRPSPEPADPAAVPSAAAASGSAAAPAPATPPPAETATPRPAPGQTAASDTAAAALGAASARASAGATPPPAPRPPTSVPPAPQPSVAPQSAPAAADSAAPVGQQPPQAATPARTDSAVSVDRSALDALGTARGTAPGGAPASVAADGDQVAVIQFARSSSQLDARDHEILRQVAAIQRQSGRSVVVVGHASSRTQQLDKVEHQLANLNVSMARANAVAEVLIDSGVARDRVIVEAVSDDQPMYSEAMPSGETGNQRAEIFLVR